MVCCVLGRTGISASNAYAVLVSDSIVLYITSKAA